MDDQSLSKFRALLTAVCVAGLNAGEETYDNPVDIALNQADAILECCGVDELEIADARD